MARVVILLVPLAGRLPPNHVPPVLRGGSACRRSRVCRAGTASQGVTDRAADLAKALSTFVIDARERTASAARAPKLRQTRLNCKRHYSSKELFLLANSIYLKPLDRVRSN